MCVCDGEQVDRELDRLIITMIAMMGFGNSMLCVCKTGTSCV